MTFSQAKPDARSLHKSRVVAVTGATGYVGGRLLRAFEARGIPVRCLARRPEALEGRVAATTEIRSADLRRIEEVTAALEGVDTAYYLVHSMGSNSRFEKEDRRTALEFARAARTCGVRRIIYLGGLGAGAALSSHLSSRQEVGRILRESGIPTIEFRASIIIGSGSLSFELIRSLVDRLPVMLTPSWIRTLTQPIAIDDVIAYLVAALDLPVEESEVFEIGGPEQVSYGHLMREYARQRRLRRIVIPVPVLTPRISSLWLGLITPVYARVGRKLIDGVRNETVVRDPSARTAFSVAPRPVREAIAVAIADGVSPETRWTDAASSGGSFRRRSPIPLRRQIVDSRWVAVPFPPEAAFHPIQRIGGRTGWYYGDALWHLRGFVDLLLGGVGMRRGRRDPVDLAPGDPLDFWRVEAFEQDRLLRLVAEMKLPGRAWLQFRVEPTREGSIIRQTAFYDPHGLAGWLYWYSVAPIHKFVFPEMLRRIAAAAADSAGIEPPPKRP